MNLKEVSIDELELHNYFIEEGVSSLLHTILFVRAPNFVKPEDYNCKRLSPLTFAKCGPVDVDQTVKVAIDVLLKVQIPVGPNLSKGVILLSFFERRVVKGYFGLTSHEEKVYFERWKIPILANNSSIDFNPPLTPSSSGSGKHSSPSSAQTSSSQASASEETNIQFQRLHVTDITRNQVQQRILSILEAANNALDHVPSTLYEYEIEVVGPVGERREESMFSRLINANAPGYLNAI